MIPDRGVALKNYRHSRANYFNYINLSHPDPSGMLRFLTDELQEAENMGDRGRHVIFCGAPVLKVCSLDLGARPERMGRHKSFVEPY